MKKIIVITWSTNDVLDVREDLSEEQAEKVLLMVEREHNADVGINWDVLRETADRMFPVEVGVESSAAPDDVQNDIHAIMKNRGFLKE